MPGVFRNDACASCCPQGCDYFADSFDRADSTDLGADWTEDVGDWSIASNLLTVSTANASVSCNTEHPTAGTAYRLSVALRGGEEGDALRAWINDDPTTFGEVTFHTNGATGRARLRLFVADVLVGETDIYAPPGEWVYLYLCTDGDHLAVGVGGTLYLSAPVTITSSVCGLATGALDGATAAKFDNFKLTKDVGDDATCPACGESCTYFADGFLGNPLNQLPALTPTVLSAPAGSWTWAPRSLRTSSASALLLADLENPDGLAHAVYSKHFVPAASYPTPRARIIADYQDSDNYLYAEHWKETETSERISLIRRAAGAETTLLSWQYATYWWTQDIVLDVGASAVSLWLGSPYTGVGLQCVGRAAHTPTQARGGFGSGNAVGTVDCWYLALRKDFSQLSSCLPGACPGGNTCAHCSTTPSAWDITIGVVVYRATQDPADPCHWIYTAESGAGCDFETVELTVSHTGPPSPAGETQLTVTATTYTEEALVWNAGSGGYHPMPCPCATLSAYGLYIVGEPVCEQEDCWITGIL